MLGGMWGAKLDNLLGSNRLEIADAATKLFQYRPDQLVKGLDQHLLRTFIWPKASQNLVRRKQILHFLFLIIFLFLTTEMAHDSYCCAIMPQGSRPFPTRRKSKEYVGQVHLKTIQKDDGKVAQCPKECRPSNHIDWKFC